MMWLEKSSELLKKQTIQTSTDTKLTNFVFLELKRKGLIH